jgi:acyl-CoA synthetase (AMP-forming)/AMP-acid ligase II
LRQDERAAQAFEYYGVPEECRSISALLAHVAARRPNELAVSDGRRELTWRELDEAASAFAAQVAGCKRLGVLAGDTLEMLIVLLGSARAHVTFCPMPTPYTPTELSMTFGRLGTDAVFAPEPYDQRLMDAGFGPERLRRVTPDWTARAPSFVIPGRSVDDVAWIIWTSGSTAAPKPVRVPERAAILAGYSYTHAMQTGPEDKWLNFFPFFHLSGCWTTMHSLAAQCSQRLMPDGFDPEEALHALTDEGVSRVGGFELFWTRLRALPEWENADLSKLTAAGISGNLTLYDLLEEIGVPLITAMYGSTESGFASVTDPDDTDREGRKYSNGHPTFGTEVRIVDLETGQDVPVGQRGEIWTRGPGVSLGYVGEDTDGVFDSEGWVHSGDVGWLDADGRLFFRGRTKQMVKTGGENVSCREVEIALETLCEGVLTAQVVGAPDPEWGEAVVAFVELRTGSTLDPAALRGRLRQDLAGFKVPKEYIEVPSGAWPLTANGKILRSELEATAAKVRADSLAASKSSA